MGKEQFNNTTFALHGLFYLLALTGFLLERKQWRSWLFSWPFAFTWFNLRILLGDLGFLMDRRLRAYRRVVEPQQLGSAGHL